MVKSELQFKVESPAPCDCCCWTKGNIFAVDVGVIFSLVTLVAVTALREISIASLYKYKYTKMFIYNSNNHFKMNLLDNALW